jgi:3-phytase
MRILSSGPLPALLLAFSCSLVAFPPAPAHGATPGAKAQAAPPRVVTERYVSPPQPGEELDSLATWRHPDGGTWLIATAKSSHRLVVFDADTGQRLREIGGKGEAAGEFRRPNGIAVLDDRLFVVERDNRRVQVFALPEFRPLGSFGGDTLRTPYGLWLNPQADGIEAFVTDSFMYGERFDVLPKPEEMSQRVRRYRLRFDADGTVRGESLGSFGATDAANALRIVESIAGDPAHDRLLIADEYQPHSTLREYTFAGRATGRSIPENVFAFEAEGVALWTCGRDRGYWVAVDQLSPLTVFHFFDRRTLKRIGSFTGATVAATDGIALRTAPTRRFPAGALFAVHDDTSVAAFDLRDIAATLRLDRACR